MRQGVRLGEEREDRAAARAYLRVLSSDLDQMRASLQDYRAFEDQKTQAAGDVLRVLAGDVVDASDLTLRADLWTLTSRRTVRLVSAAYTDLISTGNLRLIRNRALREQLLQFFAEVSRVELVIEKNNTALVDELYFPHLIDLGIAWAPDTRVETNPELRAATGRLEAALGDNLERALLPMDAAPLGDAEQAKLRQLVITRARVSSIGLLLAGALDAKAGELQAAVESELAAR